MAYCYIDVENDYKLFCNREAILLIPEFRLIALDAKYGWNHFYYVFLFCSREPFGTLPEDLRDQRISGIIENFPYSRGDNMRTHGFYKTRIFQKAQEVYKELFPDTIFDTWSGYVNDIRTLNLLKSKLDLSKEEDLGTLGGYLEMLGLLAKLYKEAEKDMQANVKRKQTQFAQAALMKEIQGE